jgi:hypothetical protein
LVTTLLGLCACDGPAQLVIGVRYEETSPPFVTDSGNEPEEEDSSTPPVVNLCEAYADVAPLDVGSCGAADMFSATASSSSLEAADAGPLNNPPPFGIDGDPNTRWSTGIDQLGNEWFQLDFGESKNVAALLLHGGNTAQSPNDWPVELQVRVSNVSGDFSATVALLLPFYKLHRCKTV